MEQPDSAANSPPDLSSVLSEVACLTSILQLSALPLKTCNDPNCEMDTRARLEQLRTQEAFNTKTTNQSLDVCLDHMADYLDKSIENHEESYEWIFRRPCRNEPDCLSTFGDRLEALSTMISTILGLKNCPVEQRDQRQKQFLEACQRRRCYGAALCAAVLTRSFHKVEHLHPLMDLKTIQNVLYVCSRYLGSPTIQSDTSGSGDLPPMWLSLLEILTEHPEYGSFKLGRQFNAKFYTHRPPDIFIQCLVANGGEVVADDLHDALMYSFKHNDIQLFDQFITVMEKIRDTWLTLQDCKFFLRLMQLPFYIYDIRVSFKCMWERFLRFVLSSTRPHLHLKYYWLNQDAVQLTKGNLHYTKLLYKLGHFDQEQMVKMSKKLLQSTKADINDIETVQCIHEAASAPRRLEDCCILTISVRLGYRSVEDRTAKVQTLRIPDSLKNGILFENIIKDFADDNDKMKKRSDE